MRDTPILPLHPVLLHGGDWNPDQWLDRPDIIDRDLELMQQAGCSIFSLGIFAWSALERPDGQFTMDWMQSILDKVHARGFKVFLATPSGSKPIWLARRHPEICRMDREGRRAVPRGRHNHCPTSPVYRQAVERINTELAQRFAPHPAVAGWHIGNEFSGDCYCPLCLTAFRNWLKERFKDVETLNKAMWSDFWGHRYTAWEDVFPQDPYVDGMALEWRRFASDRLIDFIRHEIASLRRAGATQPATTNLMGFHPDIDQRALAPHVDFIANDLYPEYYGAADQIPMAVRCSLIHDLMRSNKMRTFLQMECSPSVTNWQRLSRCKRPGLHRLEMLSALAHGADGTMYFQWRAGRGAHEKWHGAVVDHSGSPETRVFQEVAEHGVLLTKLKDLVGAKNQNQVAILFDWETRWALETSCLPREFGPDHGYMDTLEQCYRPLWERGIGVDIRSRSDDLSQYRLVVLPMGYMLTETDAQRLETFVKNGGILLATWLTGRVGPTNLCHLGGFPGPNLRKVFGLWAEELDQTSASDTIVAKSTSKNWNIHGGIDRVRLEGAKAIASLSGDPLNEGLPALTQHRYGKGQAWYCAARPAETVGFSTVLATVLVETPIKGHITTPQNGLSVQVRSDGKQEWIFVLNFHDQQSVEWQVPKGSADAETGAAITEKIILPPLGSRVLIRRLSISASDRMFSSFRD